MEFLYEKTPTICFPNVPWIWNKIGELAVTKKELINDILRMNYKPS